MGFALLSLLRLVWLPTLLRLLVLVLLLLLLHPHPHVVLLLLQQLIIVWILLQLLLIALLILLSVNPQNQPGPALLPTLSPGAVGVPLVFRELKLL